MELVDKESRDKAEEEAAFLEDRNREQSAIIAKLLLDLEEANKRIGELKRILVFYATLSHYDSQIDEDLGSLARSVLEKNNEET